MQNEFDRRAFLKTAGAMGMVLAEPGNVVYERAAPGIDPAAKPEHSIQFAVIGMDHNHILSMTSAVQRGGGKLASCYSRNTQAMAEFQARFGPVRVVASEDEILNDPAVQLVAGAPVPDQRAALAVRVMRHGKDFLSDKPGVISLAGLAEVRRVMQETSRLYMIMYSERLEVRAAIKAGELVKAGAIGKVVQTLNLAPHRVNAPSRPEWFWDTAHYGGILCDIGSHQAEQFVFYTGSTTADVTAAQVGNANHAEHPKFEDFGDMMLHGNGGTGYVRVDWFTPNGLDTWGDGRLFILGTEGYMELRKYADIAGRKGGDHLFVVDQKQARYIDCRDIVLPFGPQLVGDVVNRTHVAQDPQVALLATELVLKAQQQAKRIRFG